MPPSAGVSVAEALAEEHGVADAAGQRWSLTRSRSRTWAAVSPKTAALPLEPGAGRGDGWPGCRGRGRRRPGRIDDGVPKWFQRSVGAEPAGRRPLVGGGRRDAADVDVAQARDGVGERGRRRAAVEQGQLEAAETHGIAGVGLRDRGRELGEAGDQDDGQDGQERGRRAASPERGSGHGRSNGAPARSLWPGVSLPDQTGADALLERSKNAR